jgi:cytoplasmic iron level regulating protein YaaA (DUF328/UPF0246 family)
MLVVISPAKTLDFKTPIAHEKSSTPEFGRSANELAAVMRKLKPAELSRLMGISSDLALLNHTRYLDFSPAPSATQTRQALFAFKGDVYLGLDAATLDHRALDYAQARLRMLSGLYGVLRPYDRIQAYRLEMGCALKNPRGRDLYAFWGARIAQALREQARALRTRSVINLASQEYWQAVDEATLDLDVISPQFKDWQRGQYRFLSFYGKRARGVMARFIIERRCRKARDLEAFDVDGYRYNAELSSARAPVFTRKSP